MPEQNQKHNQSSMRTPKQLPKILMSKRKVNQIENKAYFFQGQLDELLDENKQLKAQLIYNKKRIIETTDILRRLLPVNQDDINKKLKLEMSNLQEICQMIQDDWQNMEGQIKNNLAQLIKLQEQNVGEKKSHESTRKKYKQWICDLDTKHQVYQRNVIQNYQRVKQQHKKQLQMQSDKMQIMKNDILNKQKQIEKLNEDYSKRKYELNCKISQFEKSTKRLRQEINGNIKQFENSKNRLKDIYNKIMQDKIDEQNENFELMLKQKEEEKLNLNIELENIVEEKNKVQREKKKEIENLGNRNKVLNEELIQRKEQINEKIKSIHTYQKQIKQIEKSKGQLQENIRQIQNNFTKERQNYQMINQKIIKENHKYQIEAKNLSKEIIHIQEQKGQLGSKLSAKKEQIKTKSKQIKVMEVNHKNQLEQSNQQWSKKIVDLIQTEQLMNTQLTEAKMEIKTKQEIIIDINQKNIKNIKQINQQYQYQTKQMVEKYENIMIELSNKHKNEKDEIKIELTRKINDVTIMRNEEMRILIIENNKKIYSVQEKFKEREVKIMNEMKEMTEEKQIFRNKYENLVKQLQNCDKQYSNKIIQLKEEVKQILLSKEIMENKLRNQMIEQIQFFKKQLQQKEAKYQQSLGAIQKRMKKQIEALKQSNAIEEIQNKYLQMIFIMQKDHKFQIEEIAKENNKMIQQKEQQNKIQIEKLNQEHKIEVKSKQNTFEGILQEQCTKHQKDIVYLAQKLQDDICMLNVQLDEQKKEHQISKMTREEKIEYLCVRIKDLKDKVREKEEMNLNLEITIADKIKQLNEINQHIEEVIKKRKQELEQEKEIVIKQCQQQIENNVHQCQVKVMNVETDRLEHTQIMYEEFEELKLSHKKEKEELVHRYNELQKVFEERPSRAQDLYKIKQLMQQKGLMDLQMKSYQKKVQHAHEIVKYMKLELQNYKQVYDIFGPVIETESKIHPLNNDSPLLKLIKSQKQSLGSVEKIELINSEKQEEFKKYSQNNNNQSMVKQVTVFPHLKLKQSKNNFNNNNNNDYCQQHESIERKKWKNKKLQKQKKQEKDRSQDITLNVQNFLKMMQNNNNNNNNQRPVRLAEPNQNYSRRKYFNKIRKNKRIYTLGVNQKKILNHSNDLSIVLY